MELRVLKENRRWYWKKMTSGEDMWVHSCEELRISQAFDVRFVIYREGVGKAEGEVIYGKIS